jgi:choline dehydrogenase
VARACDHGAFLRSSDDVRSPDIQIHCLSAFVVDHGRQRLPGHGVTINTCNLRPKSIGQITLRSANPLDNPAIDPNFLGDPYDWELSIEGFKRGREIMSAPSFAALVEREHMPGAHVRTDSQIRATSGAGRRPTTTPPARARWAMTTRPSSTPTCASAASTACA